jgi:hypothetical protein
MAQQILQINCNYCGSKEEYEKIASSLSLEVADVPGCVWTIWLLNEETKEAGGIYLFTDEFALDDYKSSRLMASLFKNPALTNFKFKEFDALERVSRTTRGPLLRASTAA